ncbi:MAG: beta-N-acetylhexosaminidase [Kiritimatiellae bacterium]|nr:beta-N-acetylhexosaminidase [Kiritimatiellia bacterium]
MSPAKRNTPPAYPWPRNVECLPGRFALRRTEGIRSPAAHDDVVAIFRDDLAARHGIRIAPSTRGRIAVKRSSAVAAEGYVLDVRPDQISLRHRDRAGLLYGLDTLLSLIRREGSRAVIPACRIEDAPYKPIRGIHLYMPSRDHIGFFKNLLRFLARLRMNTVFLEVGGGMEFKKHPELNEGWEKFIRYTGRYNEEAVARIQGARGLFKDSIHPELGGGSYLTQDEVRELVDDANRLAIQIVPEVQSLSHSYYLCLAHPEIAERSDDPFPDTYCPSNPKSYRLLFDVLDEIIGVIRPRMIHIGHDEWYSIGLCPKCQRKSGAELYVDDVTKISRYLAKRGITSCLWGDKILNFVGDDGKRYGGVRRERVNPKTGGKEVMRPTYQSMKDFPRDVILAHWYYSLSRKIDATLVRNGLTFFYGNFRPSIFQNWAGRSKTPNCLGGEVSTWVEVSERVFGMTGQFLQFIVAANMLWSDRTAESSPLPPDLRLGAIDSGAGKAKPVGAGSAAYAAAAAATPALRRDITGGLLPSERPKAVFTCVDIGPHANVKARGKLNGLAFDVSALPAGQELDCHGVPVRLARRQKRAVGLGLNTTDQVIIPFGGKADSLVFLHALCASGLVPGSYHTQRWEAHTAAVYRIVYDDNSFVELPVVTEHTIGLLNASYGARRLAQTFPAFPAWTDGKRTAYAYEWVNPHPGKTIARVFLEGTGATRGPWNGPLGNVEKRKGGVLLFGVTAVK